MASRVRLLKNVGAAAARDQPTSRHNAQRQYPHVPMLGALPPARTRELYVPGRCDIQPVIGPIQVSDRR